MAGESLGRIEEHAFFIVFVAFILIIFWHGVWELLTEFTLYIHLRYGIPKWKIYVFSIMFVLLIIGICPQVLDKL
jgi:hypothetical protein